MIEAVGANHWDEYFVTVDRVLGPGGRFGLQAILQDDATMRATADTYTWIRKYIFPGGQIASVPAIERTLSAHTSLRIADRYNFGRHYAETLRRWRARFEDQSQLIEKLGFDETFRRMWSLYLAYSEAGFRTGYLDVAQLTLTKP
jgi:cyclopropane-fatty-acyl-phospholipid synthase